ncbi:SRPBCC domain-containing protein [Streptomyces sp. NPDC090106]|uniref:SRPBCC domain-containing protein n=1 Tax=Streptomyces sp. NPDC090106 TaxID=3365946 RepID=UPI00381A112E
MSGSVEQGTGQTHGSTRLLHFLVRLSGPMGEVWTAVATPEGLAAWCTTVDVLEPHLGGAVTLGDGGGGRITAWDVDRVAEYTLESGGRLRFHLERDGDAATVLRFTHESIGAQADEPLWRSRFERLVAVFGPP